MAETQASASTEQHALEVGGLGRRFGLRWVVRDLAFSVPADSVTALLGRNGIGKTTTISMALGLLRPSAGWARVLGEDPGRRRSRVMDQVGYVSERRELLEDQSVGGLMQIVDGVRGERFDRQGCRELLNHYGLTSGLACSSLSTGQRARLLLALAVSARPRLLVLDEPTNGLDVVVRQDFLERIAAYAAEDGSSVLFSTHLIEDVERVCERVVVLRESGPPFVGSVDELRAACRAWDLALDEEGAYAKLTKSPAGFVISERGAKTLTLVGAADAELPARWLEEQRLASAERTERGAILKESFVWLTAPEQEGWT